MKSVFLHLNTILIPVLPVQAVLGDMVPPGKEMAQIAVGVVLALGFLVAVIVVVSYWLLKSMMGRPKDGG
ncbi:MAG: hypothetical protein JXA21_17245 [Anaerolineae bacterium]|nr:hypothetical protein [Anaerolineae bacterium]